MERGGKVRAEVINDQKWATLIPNVWNHVEKGSAVYTDEWKAYGSLQADYLHEIINHGEAYVRENGRVSHSHHR